MKSGEEIISTELELMTLIEVYELKFYTIWSNYKKVIKCVSLNNLDSTKYFIYIVSNQI